VILRGNFRILLFYDVAEAFDTAKLRELLGSRGRAVQRAFPRRTPEYVSFEHAPVVERAGLVTLKTGEQIDCSIKYYAYGVAVARFELPFECDWGALLAQASRWMNTADLEPCAHEAVREHLQQVAPAVIRPSDDWLQEQYFVIDLQEIEAPARKAFTATELLATHGDQIVQLIRGEMSPLAPRTSEEALQASASYYPSDLVVVGSAAAFVYDRPEDAVATIQILEYARTQLLEFRYYDNLMTRVLSAFYSALDQKRRFPLWRRNLPREAARLNTLRLDVMEFTERIDNAIKFVSDIFYARVYRLAAGRMGVPDYRALVEEKLRTAGELYEFMVDQFNEARTFVLEVAIAIACLLDVILLLRGK
jgi:hypothetical protein